MPLFDFDLFTLQSCKSDRISVEKSDLFLGYQPTSPELLIVQLLADCCPCPKRVEGRLGCCVVLSSLDMFDTFSM